MSKKNKNVEETGVINAPLNNAELNGDNNANLPAAQPKKGKGAKKNEDKVGFGTRVKNFFKGIVSELKKVSWPTAGKVFAQFGTVCFVDYGRRDQRTAEMVYNLHNVRLRLYRERQHPAYGRDQRSAGLYI